MMNDYVIYFIIIVCLWNMVTPDLTVQSLCKLVDNVIVSLHSPLKCSFNFFSLYRC